MPMALQSLVGKRRKTEKSWV